MNLDLRFNGRLNKEASLILDVIVKDKRLSFTKLIDQLSINFENNLDWHLAGPASRNTLASPFFLYYCSLYLIEYLLNNNNKITLIIIDSIAFENILNDYLISRGKKIAIKNTNSNLFCRSFSLIKPYIIIFIELFRQLAQFICAYKTKKNNIKKIKSKRGITIIDIFAFPGFIIKDRYYNGLWDSLSANKKETTYFVPTIVLVPLFKMLETFKKLRRSTKNYLIKEDYLTINDLLYSIFHYFRVKNINPPQIKVLNVDISTLIIEEIKSMRSYSSSVIGLLNYRFAKQLKSHNIDLTLIIDWFENQVIDKGWNAGFNKYYSSVRSIGYSGQIQSLNYLCSFPSKSDIKLSLLPSEICVTGKNLIQRTKQYSNDLNVVTAPAFRFKHLWDKTTLLIDKKYFTVLITLSQFENQSIALLKMVYKYAQSSDINNIIFWIKPHPSIQEKVLKKWWGKEWPEEFHLIRGDFSLLIMKSNLLISGMSSVCLETIAMGIPLIIIENVSGLRFNSIPEELSSKMWQNCKSPLDLKKSINYFRSRTTDKINEDKKIGLKIKKNYFEKVTPNTIARFLETDRMKELN